MKFSDYGGSVVVGYIATDLSPSSYVGVSMIPMLLLDIS